MYSRILAFPAKKSFFLFGPRGTGKTTWVRSVFKKALYLDLLEAELFTMLLANPGRLDGLIPEKFSDWVIIDEIQKVPELLDEIHRLIEKRKLKFILTGSSPRKIRRKGVNLLAGRALTLSLFPLSIQELKSDFKIDHSLQYGCLPSVYIEEDPGAYLKSYVGTYLEEEIRQEGVTRNLAGFARFLESASFSQGSVLNVSEIARDSGVGRKSVEGYFQVLQELQVAYQLPVFLKKAKRRMLSHPKFYFFDTGMYRAIRPAGPLDRPEEIDGIALETLFLQELKALTTNMNPSPEIYYWSTSNQIEVDFIVYGRKKISAFEIKRTARLRSSDSRGLTSFLREYPRAKAYLIYGGKRSIREKGIHYLTIKDAFKKLPELI